MRLPVKVPTIGSRQVGSVRIGWRRWSVYWNPFSPAPHDRRSPNRGHAMFERHDPVSPDGGASFPSRKVGSARTRRGAERLARAHGRSVYYGYDGPYFSIWVERDDA